MRNNNCKRNSEVVDCLEVLEDWARLHASLLEMLPRAWMKWEYGVENLGRELPAAE